MLIAALLLNSLLLLISIINFALIRKPFPATQISGLLKAKVVILLPVRNEAENIERILKELLAQQGLENYQVVVINDNSEDETAALARGFSSPLLKVLDAPAPQPGWIGKVSALDYGFNQIADERPEYIVSIDADVSFEQDAISRAVATIEQLKLDFLSPYPRQISLTWPERMIQPLLQWSWMSTVLLRGAEKLPMKSTAICNGQFLLMKTASLIASGGFASVSNKVLDDIELGRSFIAAGFRGVVIDGSGIASTRMYSSLSEIKSGYGKSLKSAFGGALGSIVAAAFMVISAIVPFIYSLSGNLLAIAALFAIISTRIISAISSSARIRDAFLHPFSALFFLYLLYFSWSNRSQIKWKGRSI